jgi:hypothetical protein
MHYRLFNYTEKVPQKSRPRISAQKTLSLTKTSDKQNGKGHITLFRLKFWKCRPDRQMALNVHEPAHWNNYRDFKKLGTEHVRIMIFSKDNSCLNADSFKYKADYG